MAKRSLQVNTGCYDKHICPWCRQKYPKGRSITINCKCGFITQFCHVTGFAVRTKAKNDKRYTVLIGPHGEHYEIVGRTRLHHPKFN